MLERKAYQDLLKWKAKKGRTALLIEGARRVGKSTLIREFGRKEYRSMLYIDCSRWLNPCGSISWTTATAWSRCSSFWRRCMT